jgi:hypothetical protein
MKPFAVALFAGICALFVVQCSHAEVAVGNCRPHLVSYSTISEAVAAAPANATVLVCPGSYPEQVAINQPLVLKGLTDRTGNRAIITVPVGGLVGDDPSQLLVQQPGMLGNFGPVDISNLIVDGSGFDFSTGEEVTGIEYAFASGSIENVELRNQTFGIAAYGGDFGTNRLNIEKSSIHDFSNTGILTGSNGGSGFLVNLISNRIASADIGTTGAIYDFATGIAVRNTISVTGQGLVLENYFCCVTAKENTIVGSNIGIYLGGSLGFSPTTVTGNFLFNNGTGIFIYISSQNDILKSNVIEQSTVTGIDAGCSSDTLAENNFISAAPIGVANVGAGDFLERNTLYNVKVPTTPCTD